MERTSRQKRNRVSRDLAAVALAVALIAVCAQIAIPVGEVPFTLQLFAVFLIGGLLGWKRGSISVAVYLLMGLCGIPVFAGFKAGAAALFGATGGYLLGFLPAVLVSGLFKLIPVTKKSIRTVVFFSGMLLGLGICYLFGTVWFILIYKCSAVYALSICVVPYLLPDFLKILLAATVSVRLEKNIR